MPMNIVELQAIVDRAPLNRWLRMAVQSIDSASGSVAFVVRWRDELISSPERQSIHGGILATFIDGAGNYAIAVELGRAVPTVSLHVDYHRRAGPGDLSAVARPIHIGRTISTAEVLVFDSRQVLVASGRGTYFTGSVEPGT
jgi:uncharacterized protein (TIGR00369 family)